MHIHTHTHSCIHIHTHTHTHKLSISTATKWDREERGEKWNVLGGSEKGKEERGEESSESCLKIGGVESPSGLSAGTQSAQTTWVENSIRARRTVAICFINARLRVALSKQQASTRVGRKNPSAHQTETRNAVCLHWTVTSVMCMIGTGVYLALYFRAVPPQTHHTSTLDHNFTASDDWLTRPCMHNPQEKEKSHTSMDLTEMPTSECL